MIANTDCILYKFNDDLRYVLQGHASDESDNAHYKRYGLAIPDRGAAVAHTSELAKQQDIPESEIFEDFGAGDF